MLDLQQVALSKLIVNNDKTFYSKLYSEYFEGISKIVFNRIQEFYKANNRLPTTDELVSLRKDDLYQNYLVSEVLSGRNKSAEMNSEFIVSQLQDQFVRNNTIEFLDTFLDNLGDYETLEVIDQLQRQVLKLYELSTVEDSCFDVGKDSDLLFDIEDFKLFTSGLSHYHDAHNGGFALQEYILLGGRRGSGKSIISLNLARHRYEEGNSVAFFSIEMRYKEVYNRLMSAVSGIPFLTLFKNKLDLNQKKQFAISKLDFSYDKNDSNLDKYKKFLSEVDNLQDYEKLATELKVTNPIKLSPHKFFIIDDVNLTIPKIDNYLTNFKNKYPDFTMKVVDYINIVAAKDNLDWKTQLDISNQLKRMARQHDITTISPYQIDSTGEARFAKGILDSADRSFIFSPADVDASGNAQNFIKINTAKVRNGKPLNFDVSLDWSCVKLDPSVSDPTNEMAHKKVKYGDKETIVDAG